MLDEAKKGADTSDVCGSGEALDGLQGLLRRLNRGGTQPEPHKLQLPLTELELGRCLDDAVRCCQTEVLTGMKEGIFDGILPTTEVIHTPCMWVWIIPCNVVIPVSVSVSGSKVALWKNTIPMMTPRSEESCHETILDIQGYGVIPVPCVHRSPPRVRLDPARLEEGCLCRVCLSESMFVEASQIHDSPGFAILFSSNDHP